MKAPDWSLRTFMTCESIQARFRTALGHLAVVAALAILVAPAIGPADDATSHDQETDAGGGILSETMHRLYGVTILGLSTALLREESGTFTARRFRYAVPAVTIAAGGLLAIDPLLHGSAAPTNDGDETRQHVLLGGLLFAVGSVDLASKRGGSITGRGASSMHSRALAAEEPDLLHARASPASFVARGIRSAARSSMSMTWLRCATCIASASG